MEHFWKLSTASADMLPLRSRLLLVQIAIYLTYFGRFRPLVFGLIVIMLVAATPFAFFNSFMMPDAFTGGVILAIAALAVFGQTMRVSHLAFWFLALTVGLSFHLAHIAVAMIVLFGLVVLTLTRVCRASWRGLGVVATALVVAVVGNLVVNIISTKIKGVPPLLPPLVTARLINDGIGYRYLAQSCPKSGFAICNYLDRLRGIDLDTFLWSNEPGVGFYETLTLPEQRAISDEQMRFVLATARFDPVGIVVSSMRNFFTQLVTFNLYEFNYTKAMAKTLSEESIIPPSDRRVMLDSPALHNSVPTTFFDILTWIAVLLSIGVLGRFYVVTTKFKDLSKIRFAMTLVLACFLTNTAVCSLLSGPFPRYEARVIWLLPFLAMLTLIVPPAACPASRNAGQDGIFRQRR
jgi:hypothetical protein